MTKPEEEQTDQTLARLDPARARQNEAADKALMLAHAAGTLASDKKADDITILSVGNLTSYADYFVVSSAPSDRQVNAIASSIEDTFRRGGQKPLGVEGKNEGGWVLLDFGDFVVHTFSKPAREYYDIEGFWADAKRIELDEEIGNKVIADLQAAFDEAQKAKAAV